MAARLIQPVGGGQTETPNLLDRIAMKNELKDELGLLVDPLTDESLHPLLRDEILGESLHTWNTIHCSRAARERTQVRLSISEGRQYGLHSPSVMVMMIDLHEPGFSIHPATRRDADTLSRTF